MNLFRDIEGKKGEELTSAVLRHLLLRSSGIREILIKKISGESRQGPLSMESRFSCTREEATEDKDKKRGRLDLVLETDDAIIGIENKIFAGWQDGQPGKYLGSLREKAESLQKMTGREVRHLLTVLVPSSREIEAKEKVIGVEQHCVVITWEVILDEMEKQVGSLDPSSAAILHSLKEFILGIIGFMPEFKHWLPHFRRGWISKGNSYQNQLVSSIWRFFPDSGPRLGAGDTWLGYYFALQLKAERGWYGFVQRSSLTDLEGKTLPGMQDHQAELVVATSFPINSFSKNFLQVKVNHKNFLGLGPEREVFCWVVGFNEQWEAPSKWISELRPLSDEFSKFKPADVGQ